MFCYLIERLVPFFRILWIKNSWILKPWSSPLFCFLVLFRFVMWYLDALYLFLLRKGNYQASLAFQSFSSLFVSLIFWCFFIYAFILMEIKSEFNWIHVCHKQKINDLEMKRRYRNATTVTQKTEVAYLFLTW